MRLSEKLVLGACAVASLVLRALAFFRYRFDSDEPQHLHVAWGWTAGLVQYRDTFDNHAPLFHILTAPLLGLFGERADILFDMRGAMLPLFAIVIALTCVIARHLYSTRVALWSAVLLSLFPEFFLKSLEYRTDNLWNTLWMAAFAILVTGPTTAPRFFFAGLALGTALTVSMKTPLLVVTLVLAAAIVSIVRRESLLGIRPLLAATGGFVIAPAIIAAVFLHLGAWRNLVYCVFTFNEIVTIERPHAWLFRLLWPLLIAAIFLAARRWATPEPLAGRLFCSVAFAVFFATLFCFWILISPRDMLPVMPVGAILVVAAVDRLRGRLAINIAMAVLCIGLIFQFTRGFANHTEEFTTMMNQTLRLTRPGDLIMDLKGETIYRQRPFYYIFELITRSAIDDDLIDDTIPEDVVRRRCYVAQADGPQWSERGRLFLRDNFLDLGRLRAAGQWLAADGTFTIAVPGPYVIVNEMGLAPGVLDHITANGAIDLEAGPHDFDPAVPGERLAVLWAPAFQRGFSPFHLQDREFDRTRALRHKPTSRKL